MFQFECVKMLLFYLRRDGALTRLRSMIILRRFLRDSACLPPLFAHRQNRTTCRRSKERQGGEAETRGDVAAEAHRASQQADAAHQDRLDDGRKFAEHVIKPEIFRSLSAGMMRA